jgi:hypothetical protein
VQAACPNPPLVPAVSPSLSPVLQQSPEAGLLGGHGTLFDEHEDLREEHEAGSEEYEVPHWFNIRLPHRSRPEIDVEALAAATVLLALRETMDFMLALRNTSLDDPTSKMSAPAIAQLCNPPHVPIQIANHGVRHSISTYLALEHSFQRAYECICRSSTLNFSDSVNVKDILSYYATEKIIAEYTGVEAVEHDMCPEKSCMAFTGPYSDFEECKICGASWWDQGKLLASGSHRKEGACRAVTIPLGPQLQARFYDPESSQAMQYLHRQTQQVLVELEKSKTIPVIDDIAMGHDYLHAVLDGNIKLNDIVVPLSIDSAQLYKKKQSDCWIYIWIIMNLAPDM